LRTGFFVHKGIISAVKRIEFISDRMSHINLRGHWRVLTVPAPTEDKGDKKDAFYKELEHVFSVPKVPHENFVRRFQGKLRESSCFQILQLEMRFHTKLLMIIELE
jgi:hypothetical protein